MSTYKLPDQAMEVGEAVAPPPGQITAEDLAERAAANAELVRRAHAAFKANDQATIAEIFAEDIEWIVTGHSQTATVDHGMAEVGRSFLKIMEMTGGTYDAVGTDYLGGANTAIARAHVTASREGKGTLDVEEVVVFDVRDGKLARAVHIPFDQDAWDDFFA